MEGTGPWVLGTKPDPLERPLHEPDAIAPGKLESEPPSPVTVQTQSEPTTNLSSVVVPAVQAEAYEPAPVFVERVKSEFSEDERLAKSSSMTSKSTSSSTLGRSS